MNTIAHTEFSPTEQGILLDASPESPFPELSLTSTIGQLELFSATLSTNALGKEAKKLFSAHPLLPGILLVQHQKLIGMISRQQFFALMSQPYSLELFLKRPIQAVHDLISIEPLILSSDLLITIAAQQSLQRPTDCLYEPIVIRHASDHYALLDMHQLLLAQAEIHRLTTISLQEKTQAYLYQTEKMSLLGQTVAGVSHEIKNPVNCITGNLGFLGEYIQKLVQLLALYKAEFPHSTSAINTFEQQIELDFLLNDFPEMMESLDIASSRLVNLISSIRNFSRIDREEKESIDLHKYLDGTLLILNSHIKQGIHVHKQYGDIPQGVYYPGQISQVFMNILSNGVDALMEKQQRLAAEKEYPTLNLAEHPSTREWYPRIEVTTYITDEQPDGQQFLCVTIADNGDGIPEELQSKIFEPFFTTKGIEQGTGLGLAISYKIMANHQGSIQVRSTAGEGTCFELLLPVTVSAETEELGSFPTQSVRH